MSRMEKLDNYYNSRSASEVWLMVLLAGGIVAFVIYTLLEPYSTKFKKAEIGKNKRLEKEIREANSYLDSITVNGDRNYKVNSLKKQVASKEREIKSYQAKIAKVKGAVDRLGTILYNNSNWSKFLHGIAVKAKNNNLKVYTITNKVYEQNATFGKALDVSIKTQGKYGDILAFMSDLEQTKLVSDISALSLKATDSNPIADINLTVWGIKR